MDTSDDDNEIVYECHAEPPAEWWEKAVAGWKNIPLPNLKKLVVDNAYACADNHCESINLAATAFLSAANIKNVTIKHLQDACDVDHPNIKQLPSTIQKLNLLIATWTELASSDHDLELSYRHAFFNIHLNGDWLYPLQSQLTHLTLSCNTYWGIYPRWQPDKLHFPQLKSLAFGNWTIAFDWQLNFIISHAKTLEQLTLINCPILHALRMTPRQSNNLWQQRLPGTGRGPPQTNNFFIDLRWHNVLLQFKNELPKLKHFTMARGPKGPNFWARVDLTADEAFDDRYTLASCVDTSRYAIFDYDGPAEKEDADPERYRGRPGGEDYYKNSHWLEREKDEEVRKKLEFPDCLKEDQDALEDLMRVLKTR